ncbi:MAG: rhodanese-like domain-containing protein [Myxococcota bacterium]
MSVAFEEISVEEARRRREAFHAIDVRADHEFRGPLGHVEGAALVPLPELERRASELPRDRPLLLICRSGVRSGKACQQLQALGMDSVVNLAGGMIAWNNARLPVELEPPASLAALLELVVRYAAQVGSQPPEAVRETLGSELQALGASAAEPKREALARVLDGVERSFVERGAPPDLALSMVSFRRWLAEL